MEFPPSRTNIFGRNLYALIVLDNYSLYTWTLFLSQKRVAFVAFCSDHGGELQKEEFKSVF